MSQRVDVNQELPPIRVPARVLNEMRGHALETLPEECCGLVVAGADARFGEAHRCLNEMTRLHRQDPLRHPQDGSKAFHMNEADAARIGGIHEVTGVYHSHVQERAYFSELDQMYASGPYFPFPGAVHFVISVIDGRVRDVAAFRFDSGDGDFEGRAVLAELV